MHGPTRSNAHRTVGVVLCGCAVGTGPDTIALISHHDAHHVHHHRDTPGLAGPGCRRACIAAARRAGARHPLAAGYGRSGPMTTRRGRRPPHSNTNPAPAPTPLGTRPTHPQHRMQMAQRGLFTGGGITGARDGAGRRWDSRRCVGPWPGPGGWSERMRPGGGVHGTGSIRAGASITTPAPASPPDLTMRHRNPCHGTPIRPLVADGRPFVRKSKNTCKRAAQTVDQSEPFCILEV